MLSDDGRSAVPFVDRAIVAYFDEIVHPAIYRSPGAFAAESMINGMQVVHFRHRGPLSASR